MTYHVKCPFSKKTFDFESLREIRRFVYAMMVKFNCTKAVRIYDGRQIVGTMWRDGPNVRWKSKGVRAKRIIRKDGGIIW